MDGASPYYPVYRRSHSPQKKSGRETIFSEGRGAPVHRLRHIGYYREFSVSANDCNVISGMT